MIANSSSSIGYAYQLSFILYRGKPTIFSRSFPNLFVYRQRLCCLGLTISAVVSVVQVECELQFSNAYLYNQPLIFFNSTFEFEVSHA